MPVSVKYSFTRRFNVPARKAYQWCTDYTPEDPALMKEEEATRLVQKIARETLILTDTYSTNNESVTKQRLVCLYPRKLSWTSTHLTGPNKYSQFLYQIVPENRKSSRLKFTALHLDHKLEDKAYRKETEQTPKSLKKLDSETWKILAKIMETDLGASHH